MCTTEEKIKHLEFIQNIITRMNTNSFQIKILASSLLTVFLGYVGVANKQGVWTFLLGIMLVGVLWFLDSFYLRQERLYRNLYGKVVAGEIKLFDLDTDGCEDGNTDAKVVFTSTTLLYYYVPLLFVFACVFVVSFI